MEVANGVGAGGGDANFNSFQPKESIGGGGGIPPTEECWGGVPQPLVGEG